MGCHDRHSNYTARKFDEASDTWHSYWSPGLWTVEALEKEKVVEKIGSGYPGKSLDDWDFVKLESGGWKATCRVSEPA